MRACVEVRRKSVQFSLIESNLVKTKTSLKTSPSRVMSGEE